MLTPIRFKVVVLRFTFGLFLFLGWPIWKEMTALLKDPKTYEVGDDVRLPNYRPWVQS